MRTDSHADHRPGGSGTGGDHYRGRAMVFGTRHGKQRQVAPAFLKTLGAHVSAPEDLDTDRFGTFSGEIARTLSPLDAARAKAKLAMERAGCPFGLASEASYGALPGLGLPGHEEILLFLDAERGIEVVEGHRSLGVPAGSHRVAGVEDLGPHLAGTGWPEQALIVRPSDGGDGPIVKGITDLDRLADAIRLAAASSQDGRALVEPDLRAQHNPSRRVVLRQLGTTLATRLATACPGCGGPGFGRVGKQRGLPCASCGTPTELVRAEVDGCPACDYTQVRPRGEVSAEPRWCPECNP